MYIRREVLQELTDSLTYQTLGTTGTWGGGATVTTFNKDFPYQTPSTSGTGETVTDFNKKHQEC